jgi:D-alanyl-D-alanine carboxypeptidase
MKRFATIFYVLSLLAALPTGQVWAAPSLLVDVETGAVLAQEEATQPWYPASLTKLMTFYVTLQAIEKKQLSLDSLVTMTPQATKLPPSKMGFKVGQKFSVDAALKILMVKSANDVASSLAARVAGSEAQFVAQMNASARMLGMTQTYFINPSGLPDPRQVTSARDMAILGRALLKKYSQYQDYFDIHALQLGNKIMKNHNGLIGRYVPATGMKTGFICASGFNVVASARKGGRHLLVVVLGSMSPNERTEQAAYLFEQGFSMAWGRGSTLSEMQAPSFAEPQDMRAQVCNPALRAARAAGERSDDSEPEYSRDLNENNPLHDTLYARQERGAIQRPSYLLEQRAQRPPVVIELAGLDPAPAVEDKKSKNGRAADGARMGAGRPADGMRMDAGRGQTDRKTGAGGEAARPQRVTAQPAVKPAPAPARKPSLDDEMILRSISPKPTPIPELRRP